MRFGLLGPLLVADARGALAVPAAKQRVILAALLLRPGDVVSVAELAELAWDGAPPDGAVGTLRSYVTRLRGVLGAELAPRLVGAPPGYRLVVRGDELDVTHAEALRQDATAAYRDGDWTRSADSAAAGLALWRGTPLVDVPSQLLQRDHADRLEQVRLQLNETYLAARIELGQHREVVTDLMRETAAHPLCERLAELCMLALYRAGRTADAFAAYRRLCAALRDELGVDPGSAVRTLHERMIAADPALDPVAAPPTATVASPIPRPRPDAERHVPRQLPGAIRHFVGRAAETAALTALLRQPAGSTTPVLMISGIAGVGKTVLAVHWAHGLREWFPDGQLFVNLRGFDPARSPVDPGRVLSTFLTALGVAPGDIPAGVEARAALYRSTLSERRVLIVLDNAGSTEQVRPLLPAAVGSLVLVTTRTPLVGLIATEGAVPVALDLPDSETAHAMVTALVGVDRLAAEADATAELVRLCARLPLALALAGARLAATPTGRVAQFVAQLGAASSRLDVIDAADPSVGVRAAFEHSYRNLRPAAAQLFRLLSLHPGATLSLPSVASLAGMPVSEVRPLLAELRAACLISEPVPDRFGYHDLLRDFAAELAHTAESVAERGLALRRLLDHFVRSATAAGARLLPERPLIPLPEPAPAVVVESCDDAEHATAWYEREHDAVTAMVGLAVTSGFDDYAWRLAWALVPYQSRPDLRDTLLATHELALAAARRVGDLEVCARLLRVMGHVYAWTEATGQSLRCLGEAIDLYRALGDGSGEGYTHIGFVHYYDGVADFQRAAEHAEQAILAFQRVGDRLGEGQGEACLAWDLAHVGDHEAARRAGERALRITRETNDQLGEISALDTLGFVCVEQGRLAEAIDFYERAVARQEGVGYPQYRGEVLHHLGDAQYAAGRREVAIRSWQAALSILEPLEHDDVGKLREKLSGASTT